MAAGEAASAQSMRLPGAGALLKAVCTLFDRKERKGHNHNPEAQTATAAGTAAARAAARDRHRQTLSCFRVHYHITTPERGAVAGAPCMSFWCMSAGVVMQRLQAMGVRNMLLTSGTLSPLAATAEELVVPMQVRLENPHVVAPEQVCAALSVCNGMASARASLCNRVPAPAGTYCCVLLIKTLRGQRAVSPPPQVLCSVLSKGPSGVTLNGSFANRNNASYKRDLGAALVAIAGAVPHGMLVFFPSYAAMKTIVDEWQAWPAGGSSLWKQLEGCKPIFQEPRGGGDFARVRPPASLCASLFAVHPSETTTCRPGAGISSRLLLIESLRCKNPQPGARAGDRRLPGRGGQGDV